MDVDALVEGMSRWLGHDKRVGPIPRAGRLKRRGKRFAVGTGGKQQRSAWRFKQSLFRRGKPVRPEPLDAVVSREVQLSRRIIDADADQPAAIARVWKCRQAKKSVAKRLTGGGAAIVGPHHDP